MGAVLLLAALIAVAFWLARRAYEQSLAEGEAHGRQQEELAAFKARWDTLSEAERYAEIKAQYESDSGASWDSLSEEEKRAYEEGFQWA